MEKFDVVCATDDNYAEYCAVMLCSLFENNLNMQITVHVLIETLSSKNKDELIHLSQRYGQTLLFYTVDTNKLKNVKYRSKNPLSSAAYYRILLTSILPKTVNKVLYLDCDLLVLKSVREIFEVNLDGYALAAVRDQENLPVNDEHRLQLNLPYKSSYFCSGVMLINLEYWRKCEAEEKLIEFACRKRTVYFHDQDALNYLFWNKWFELSPKWNRFNLVAYDKKNFETFEDEYNYIYNPSILHFASPAKPWLKIHFVNWNRLYKKYYEICFKRKMIRKPFEKSKTIIYKKILEVNLVNLIYRSPLFLSIFFVFVLNLLKFVALILFRKNIFKAHFFSLKNIR